MSVDLKADIEKVLVTEADIALRVQELGRELTQIYVGDELTIVAIMTGAIPFTADLMRRLQLHARLDCMRVASYGEADQPGELQIAAMPRLDLKGRHVLLIDDILDTGGTLAKVAELIEGFSPATLRTCVLLHKHGRQRNNFSPDFVGFNIPDEFVVGYGLDYAQRYRNLPFIGVLKREYQENPPWVAK